MAFEVRVTSASSRDVKQAIDDAEALFKSGVWSKSSKIFRSRVLSDLAMLLRERISDFAQIESMQTGRTISEMRAQLSRLPEWLYTAILM